ncbi:MAG: heparinase II/III family protein, partial [Clostridiales bacterium]|nr:heparinase II/III family protein [Clostridiales bacterium]
LTIFDGEYILIDDGYVFKTTEGHNTLLVGGEGQEGGDVPWFQARSLIERLALPRIVKAESRGGCDYFVGDATEAYSPRLGLAKFVRHVLFIKPNAVAIIDDIAAAGEEDRDFELRFFPEHQERAEFAPGRHLIAGRERNVLIDCSNSDGGESEFSEKTIRLERTGQKGSRRAVSVRKRCRRWQPVTVISWSGKNAMPMQVGCERAGGALAFRASGETYKVDIAANALEFEKPGLMQIEINGKFLSEFDAARKEYSYDASGGAGSAGGARIVREQFSKVELFGVPSCAGCRAEIARPQGKYGIYRIKVGDDEYSVSVTGEDRRLERVPIASCAASHWMEYSPPAHAIDGSMFTYWAAEGDGISLTADMGAAQPICGFDVAFFKGASRVSYFEAHTSVDGAEFVRRGSFESSGKTALPEYFELDGAGGDAGDGGEASVPPDGLGGAGELEGLGDAGDTGGVGGRQARYLKLVFFGNTQGKWNSVVDIGIYKAQAGA